MRLILQREPSTANATPGQIFLYGEHEAFTIEDPVRADPNPATPENEAKIPGKTAIPPGTYKIIITNSPRFNNRLLPRLLDVPGYSGVLIHPGNTAEDTAGCILPGTYRQNAEKVTGSKMAFDKLFHRITVALEQGEEVFIEVRPS